MKVIACHLAKTLTNTDDKDDNYIKEMIDCI